MNLAKETSSKIGSRLSPFIMQNRDMKEKEKDPYLFSMIQNKLCPKIAYPIKKGKIPIIALIRTGNEYSIVLSMSEYLCEYMKYLGIVDHAKRQPKPRKTSPLYESLIKAAKYTKVPIIVHTLLTIVKKPNLLYSLALSQKLRYFQAIFRFLRMYIPSCSLFSYSRCYC